MRLLRKDRLASFSQRIASGIASENDVERSRAGPESLIDSWKQEVDRMDQRPPPNCLSFLHHGPTSNRRKSLLDEDSISRDDAHGDNRQIVVARLGGGGGVEVGIAENLNEDDDDDDEERDGLPVVPILEMKENTLRLVSKAHYPTGSFLWGKAEDILQFWTNQGTEESVHLSIILLDRMVEEHERAPRWSDTQMMYWLKAVIHNWNQGQRTNEFATFTPKDLIEQIESWYSSIELDAEIYSMIIDGAAFTQPYLADSLVRRTVNMSRKGLIYSHTYNLVIRAWVDAGDPYQAEALLDFMVNEWRNRRDVGGASITAKPNRQSFHWVLLGWANSDESVAADRTEEILVKMEKFSNTDALSNIKPNAATYKWVLDCLIKATNRSPEENAERAHKIIQKLHAKAEKGDEDFRPTTEMYAIVVAAWANAGNPDKSEDLLHQLYKDYVNLNHDKRLQPNLEIFNSLLMGWSKVPSKAMRKKAGDRAEAILEHMEKLASSRVLPAVKPDIASYNTVLDCWSKCGDGKKAQLLLERMIQRWEAGESTVAPDTVSYSRVLSAYNRAGDHERCRYITNVLLRQFQDLGNYRVHPNLIMCGLARFGTQPEALRSARQLFQQMEDLYRSGKKKEFKPNTTTYAHLLECVCKADRGQGGGQAEVILKEMLDKYAAGDQDVKPNVTIYNSVMRALVKTKQPKRTEEVLAQMYEEDIRGSRVYPNLETFNLILLAWAKSDLGDQAARRGEQILRRLERIHESKILNNVKPNVESYNHVLECLTQTPDQKDAGWRADHLLKRMLEQGVEPTTISYNRVIMALKNSGNFKRAKHLLKALQKKTTTTDSDAMSIMDTDSLGWF